MVQDVAFMQAVEPAPRFEAARKVGFFGGGNAGRHGPRRRRRGCPLSHGRALRDLGRSRLRLICRPAICHAYNDWLADFCRQDATRLKGIAMIPLQDVGAAIVEARRAITTLGMVGVLMRPNPLLKRQLNDAAYAPLYAEMERLGKPVCIHSSPGSLLPEIGVNDATGLEWPQGVQRFSGRVAPNRHFLSTGDNGCGNLAGRRGTDDGLSRAEGAFRQRRRRLAALLGRAHG